ncbi:TPA: ead/Ea22-like family protein [Klebsiella pneumoniae]|nr:ead/Ea22-like family protein [Klebsiella pneumoniae]HEE3725397.1 ead/Ea22-like family protein [Klebsiella pneumoniae]
MTTDITELAQSLKAAAENAGIEQWVNNRGEVNTADYEVDDGVYIDHICDCEIIGTESPRAEFIALASPANVLALVEALEKAQAKIIELQQKCEIDPRTHEIIDLKERVENLESFRTAYMEWGDKTDWMQTDKRFDAMKPWGKHRADVLKEYIDQLESRTVTIKFTPIPVEELGNFRDGKKHPYMFGAGYNAAVIHCESVIQQELDAKGIKWEAE